MHARDHPYRARNAVAVEHKHAASILNQRDVFLVGQFRRSDPNIVEGDQPLDVRLLVAEIQ